MKGEQKSPMSEYTAKRVGGSFDGDEGLNQKGSEFKTPLEGGFPGRMIGGGGDGILPPVTRVNIEGHSKPSTGGSPVSGVMKK